MTPVAETGPRPDASIGYNGRITDPAARSPRLETDMATVPGGDHPLYGILLRVSGSSGAMLIRAPSRFSPGPTHTPHIALRSPCPGSAPTIRWSIRR
jgi:hypothetical protein